MADNQESGLADEAEGGQFKSFLEHLEDFRWVLVSSSVALAVAMLICLISANYIIQVIKWPLTRAKVNYPGTNQIVVLSFGTNYFGHFLLTQDQEQLMYFGTNRFVVIRVDPITIGTNQVLGWQVSNDPGAIANAQQMKIDLVNFSPAGGFVVAFQVALYGGAMLASPFILYFIAAFVFPALTTHEQKYLRVGLIIGAGLFLIGVAFCYFILMPVALAAAQMYSRWLGFSALQWRAEEYINFVCKFMFGMGLGFELPVVILTLVKIGILDYRMLSKARRYMVVINLVLGAVLTTPEIITQLVMFVPLQLLYEVTVWIAWYWERRDEKATNQTKRH